MEVHVLCGTCLDTEEVWIKVFKNKADADSCLWKIKTRIEKLKFEDPLLAEQNLTPHYSVVTTELVEEG
jgi:hypothetical protein